MKQLFTVLIFIFLYHIGFSQPWVEKATNTGATTGRTRGSSFAINGVGYTIGGSDNCCYHPGEVYAYDTLSNTWTLKPTSYPNNNESNGKVAFAVNGMAYVGLGVNAGYTWDNSFYSYNPVTDTWTPILSFPGAPRAYSTGFTIGGKIYVGGGANGQNLSGHKDFYVYDPVANTWTKLNDCPAAGINSFAVGFAIGNKGYIGTGSAVDSTGYQQGNSIPQDDFWEYDPSTDTWTPKANVPGGPRCEARGFASCDKGYIGGGWFVNNINSYLSDYYEYDPVQDKWTPIANFGGGLVSGGTEFTIGRTAYFYGGVQGNTNPAVYLNTLWAYNPIYTPAFKLANPSSPNICAGQSITFNDTSNYSPTNWQWSFPGGTPGTSNAQNPVVQYNTPGNYDVVLSAWNVCNSGSKTFTQYVSVSSSGTIIASPHDTSICNGMSVNLNATGGTIYSWSPVASLNNAAIANPIATPIVTTTYIVSGAGGGCTTPDTVVINVGNASVGGTVTALRDTLCEGTSGDLTLVGFSGAPLQWQSSATPGNFADITTATDTTFQTLPLLQSTWYRVRVGNGNCLSVSDSLLLFVPPALFANFSTTQSEKTITFNSDSSLGNIVSYEWTFGDGTGSLLQNPSHTYAKADTLYNVCLSVYDGSNCSYTFCKDVSLATGIEPVSAQTNWNIYPNPFGNQLFISGKELNEKIENVEIYDVLGRTVIDKMVGSSYNNPVIVDVSNLTQGMYFLKIRMGETDYLQKIVK